MLIGHVSDERFVALADVLLEFASGPTSVEARSRATGSVHAELAPGDYTVTLQKPGFGSKRTMLTIPPVARSGAEPASFRLLSDGLLGYVWPKWVRAGQPAEFRVHSVEAYHLELFRYGLTKDRIRSLGWFDEHGPRAVMQITPDGDYSQTGVAWNQTGYTSKVHAQRVLAPERAGLYYFHASTKSGAFFSFPWIVAPAQPRCPVAVLLSNINGNAYNNFGGRSNYINPACLPGRPTVNARQDLSRYTETNHRVYDRDDYAPLSFERPEPFQQIDAHEQATDPIEGRNACHLAPAEWRLLAWLEREGLDADVYAESQLHAGELRLDDYRVLVLGPHPEYWTRQMYDHVKRWVFERGGRLIYLGGNGLNCEVEM
ncbi:MAG: N,N-dimethylformamidase beta subunit family domain-containing protein, partial [Gemmataceae bacterium]